MHKIIKTLLLIISLNAFQYSAFGRTRLYNASSIDEIKNTITELLVHQDPSRALLILPLDVLIAPDHAGFYFQGEEAQNIVKTHLDKISASKRVYLEEFILTNYPQKLTETAVRELIDNIQKTNLPIIVTTENLAGSINDIRYLEVWTWNWLYERGIDLSKTPIGQKEIRIDAGTKKVGGSYPTFFRGLLSCNNYKKSNAPQIVLASLLATKFRWLPSVVYAVDKDQAYLKSLEKQFATLRPDIQFEGFIYKPAGKNTGYNQLNLQELEKFWQDLVVSTNKIKRAELKAQIDDPYENQ
jgi:hypothetical protein